MSNISDIDQQIAKLEKQKQDLIQAEKDGKLKAAKDAVKALNELGFNYQLVKAGAKPTGRRRTGIRDEVLNTVKASPNGMKRAEVLEALNADDKSAQHSVSYALSALKKAGTISLTDGVYEVA